VLVHALLPLIRWSLRPVWSSRTSRGRLAGSPYLPSARAMATESRDEIQMDKIAADGSDEVNHRRRPPYWTGSKSASRRARAPRQRGRVRTTGEVIASDLRFFVSGLGRCSWASQRSNDLAGRRRPQEARSTRAPGPSAGAWTCPEERDPPLPSLALLSSGYCDVRGDLSGRPRDTPGT
jgi:hypothetical protein